MVYACENAWKKESKCCYGFCRFCGEKLQKAGSEAQAEQSRKGMLCYSTCKPGAHDFKNMKSEDNKSYLPKKRKDLGPADVLIEDCAICGKKL